MPSQAPFGLRVAAVWGTSVIAVRTLREGESFDFAGPGMSQCAVPEGVEMPSAPLRFVRHGWELDPHGVVAGSLWVRGRAEDPVPLARTGATLAVMPGDYGLLQYGMFAVFFQHTTLLRPPGGRLPVELLVMLALFSSAVFHVSVLGIMRLTLTPDPIAKPLELTNLDELAARFRLRRASLEPESKGGEPGPKQDAQGEKVPRDHKAASQAQRASDAQLSRERAERDPESQPPNLGGLSDVLNSGVGEEVKRTLNTIQSVAAALDALSAQNMVIGGGMVDGLRGSGAQQQGVAFGAGAIQTGLGGNALPGAAAVVDPRHGAAEPPPRETKIVVTDQAPTAQGGLGGEQIVRVVRAHQGALRACYETEAQRNPNLKGGVTLAWQIDRTGAVTDAKVAASTLDNPRIEGCMVRQVKAWHFPPSDTPTAVASYPFKFGVGG